MPQRTVDFDPLKLAAQMKEYSKQYPGKRPCMLNLLRFREKADYGERQDQEPCDGRSAYARYSAVATPLLQKSNTELTYIGNIHGALLAPDGEDWDTILLVKYRSFQDFIDLFSNADYGAAVFHRTAALEDSRLILTIEEDLQNVLKAK